MDLRVQKIFDEEMNCDTSFLEKPILSFFEKKFSRKEMRKKWELGIKLGIEIGLRKASLEGQRIELTHNTTNKLHKEFIEKFYHLAAEYKCAIQYHPEIGMVIVAR